MPVAAFAASGHARALWSRRNAVERLGVGADGQVAAAWHPSHPPAAGGSIRDWGELCRAVLGETHLACWAFLVMRSLGNPDLPLQSASW
jgi:hypothetical protein